MCKSEGTLKPNKPLFWQTTSGPVGATHIWGWFGRGKQWNLIASALTNKLVKFICLACKSYPFLAFIQSDGTALSSGWWRASLVQEVWRQAQLFSKGTLQFQMCGYIEGIIQQLGLILGIIVGRIQCIQISWFLIAGNLPGFPKKTKSYFDLSLHSDINFVRITDNIASQCLVLLNTPRFTACKSPEIKSIITSTFECQEYS